MTSHLSRWLADHSFPPSSRANWSATSKERSPVRCTPAHAMKPLLAYDWPGNVRELETCLERACAFTSGPIIQVGDLPSAIHGVPATPSNAGNGKAHIMPMAELEKQTILSTIAQLNGDK